ncbi:long-chain fatty acid CoA ligase [Cryptococcus wingfieldii CBS 7118]|uniref:Long-chain fatty acid CoA ligase n=1 Tax=Cryptococcus wingfieldii CBS 7118 TaxID=1295528 RepID=A0A1E3JII5_9TREE|nr:long-chain fatty acid CoA ligase [Cryptococcus wingfieldii CBS 7118]ODO00633.1 long-chain fatty acid CoA ligase [Cryptococcus wingfieldii CBS 7118]
MSKKQLSITECHRLLSQPGSPLETEEKVIFGRRTKVWKNQAPHFREWILLNYEKHKNKIFVSAPLPRREPYPPLAEGDIGIDAREYWTFGEILDRGLKLAAWLRSRGIKLGDKVVIGGKNCAPWIVSYTAIHLLGAVPVCLNAWLPREQLVYLIKLVDSKLLLLDEDRARILSPYTRIAEFGLPPMYCWSDTTYLPSIIEVLSTPNPQGVQDILDGGGLEELGPESDGMIFFSSGTSGVPKAVLSTQRASLSSALSGMVGFARALLRAGLSIPTPEETAAEPQKAILLSVPLFHVTACLQWLSRSITFGNTLVVSDKWDIKEAVQLIQKEKITSIGGVPAIASQIMQSPDLPRDTTIDGVFYGGAPCSKGLASQISNRFPNADLSQGYGLTETNAIAVSIAGQDYLDRPESTGLPVFTSEVKIADPDTLKEVPVGQNGVILLRGVNVMKCYYNNEKATREAIDDEGWFNTGDVGCLDEEGFLYMKDRIKDLIIRGGENIASQDVENALTSHPHVNEVAAIALPHPILGETVGAALTLRATASETGKGGKVKVTEDDIIKHVRGKLAKHAVPVMVMIWKELDLPRNVNGKIVKREIRDIARQEWARRNGIKQIDEQAKL